MATKPRRLNPRELALLTAAQGQFNQARVYLDGVLQGLGLDLGKAYTMSPEGVLTEVEPATLT